MVLKSSVFWSMIFTLFNLFSYLLFRPRCWFLVGGLSLSGTRDNSLPGLWPCLGYLFHMHQACVIEKDVLPHTRSRSRAALLLWAQHCGCRQVLQNSLWKSFWLGNAASWVATVVSRGKRYAIGKRKLHQRMNVLNLQTKSPTNKLGNTI